MRTLIAAVAADLLVRREPHPTDRRSKILHLTEAGERARTRLILGFEERSRLRRLSDEEFLQLELMLRKVIED